MPKPEPKAVSHQIACQQHYLANARVPRAKHTQR
jgi:hypothetical protein